MNDERMYARLDAAIQFLNGAQPLASLHLRPFSTWANTRRNGRMYGKFRGVARASLLNNLQGVY